jgi:outer membrane protein TolC
VINARDPSSEQILMIEPSDAPTVVPYEVDLERSLKSAGETRPELIAARLDVDGKHLQQKVAENEILPRLDLVGSIGLNGLGGEDKGPVNVGGTPIPPNQQVVGGYGRSLEFLTDGRYYQYVAGARLEVPIANAQAKADYAQAKVNTERSWLSLHELEESVTLEVKTAVSNLSSDVKSIDATRIARELAEENLRNQKARYDVGLATTKDIVDYQDRLTQAQRQEIIALTAYNTDLAELRRVEGTLLDARNVVVEHPEPEKAPWWARF